MTAVQCSESRCSRDKRNSSRLPSWKYVPRATLGALLVHTTEHETDSDMMSQRSSFDVRVLVLEGSAKLRQTGWGAAVQQANVLVEEGSLLADSC